jgi:hypothetical protein
LAILVVAGMSPAAAADVNFSDLSRSCCADLDQRIAEIEAMLARKGNRRLTLEISGLVNNRCRRRPAG